MFTIFLFQLLLVGSYIYYIKCKYVSEKSSNIPIKLKIKFYLILILCALCPFIGIICLLCIWRITYLSDSTIFQYKEGYGHDKYNITTNNRNSFERKIKSANLETNHLLEHFSDNMIHKTEITQRSSYDNKCKTINVDIKHKAVFIRENYQKRFLIFKLWNELKHISIDIKNSIKSIININI